MHKRFSVFPSSWPQILPRQDTSDCVDPNPANTITDRLNIALNSSGPGFVLSLCPNQSYLIEAPIFFAFPNQEISTAGYPTGDDRAILVVNGPVFNGTGHTTAIDGQCGTCSGVILRNIQINGTRAGAPPINGGANIEMGGANSNQLIEYVHSWDPRGWSCMHIMEGALNCDNTTVQNNDIGPCGSDAFQEWADGISMSCSNSLVRNNLIQDPTDGGVVLFGAPGTRVENNTIWVEKSTLLGGVNMVDYDPWNGNFTGTIVTNNTIIGGLATGTPAAGQSDGADQYDAIIKIGIAIGPRTWFGPRYYNNVSSSGTVLNNQFSGAFSYAIAMTSAYNFTVENNVLFGNYSFIGAVGPNCTNDSSIPPPSAFILDPSNTAQCTTQLDFADIAYGDGLTCVEPPDGGDFWPYGGNPALTSSEPNTSGSASSSSPSSSSSSHHSGAGRSAGIAVGVIAGVAIAAIAAWFIRRWALHHSMSRRVHTVNNASRRSPFVKMDYNN